MGKNLWSRDELILAINLYCKLPFGQFDQKNTQVKKLAELIGRSPSAVAMKLSNFAALDSYHESRGVRGLQNYSRADKAIWEEFTSDWDHYGVESERLLQEADPTIENEDNTFTFVSEKLTEVERAVQVRLGQNFFRKTVLSSYDYRCCICGIPIPQLLIASHIIPWRERKDLRLNPHNGLCLCALHDRAFDSGMIAVSSDYRVILSPLVWQYLPNQSLTNGLEIYANSVISLPTKFRPGMEFLEFHRQEYFLSS